MLYDRVLQRHRNHFLVMPNSLIGWDTVSQQLVSLHKGKGTRRRPPYEPQVLLKILFLSYLYNVSERSMEEFADTNLLAKWFMGLAVDEPPPDHSTLTVFRRRLERAQGQNALEELFNTIIGVAKEQGVEFGELQVLDSVHTQADVDIAKEKERHDDGRPPRDPDARVVRMRNRRVVKPDGTTKQEDVTSCGYKAHTSQNVATGIVTSVHVTHGNAADNKAFDPLRAHDRELGLPIQAYGGDHAYDDTDIYSKLEQEGLRTAITLRDSWTQKKDRSKERWLALEADPKYQAWKAQRYPVVTFRNIEALEWSWALSVPGPGSLSDPGSDDCFCPQLQAGRKVTDRRNLPSCSRRAIGGADHPGAGSAASGVVRLRGERARQARLSGQHIDSEVTVGRHNKEGITSQTARTTS